MQSSESSTIPPISSRPEISSSTQQAESITSKPIESSQTTSVSYLPPVSSTYPSTTMQVNESVSNLPPVTQMTTSISYLPPSSTATTDVTSGSTPDSVSYLPPSTSTSIDTKPITSTISSPLQTGKYECNEEGFFSDPSNCKKFYRCIQVQSGYQKYEFECGPGTAWDQSVQTCNYIEQVASCSMENNEIDQGSTSSTSNPISGSVITSSTTTASSQIAATTSSSAIPISTVASIPETSMELSTPEEDKTEASSTTITSVGEKPVSGKPEEIQMPGSSSTENLSESLSESSEESSSSTESHVSDCTTQKPNNTIVCNNEGFYPHPVRCDKFYRCVDNGNGFNVYHFDCPPGTIFDPSISVCNYPESVYPARDCTTGSTTLSSVNVESTTESETSEESVSTIITTTIQSTTQQAEESTIISSTTTSSTITTTESTITSSTESTTVEVSENTENMTESTVESITAITENIIDSSSTERTEAPDSTESTESEKSTTEFEESTTESQEQSTTESQEQLTTESQEQLTTESQEQLTTESSNTEGQEQSTTESQEQSTIESQEQSTTESQEQSTTESELTTMKPASATPCAIGNLTDDQIALVCPTGFRRHPKYCNLFYQCISEGNMEIKILVLSCPENTIFDEKKIQCLPADKSSDPCIGTKANVRLYRRLENNALSPVSNSN